MMNNENTPSTGSDTTEFAIELCPVDADAAELVKQTFADAEILESSAFTGSDIITLIITSGVVGQVLEFYAKYRQRYKDAVVKVDGKEISLQGYSPDELRGLVESDTIAKLHEALQRK